MTLATNSKSYIVSVCKFCDISTVQNISEREKAGLKQAKSLFTDKDAERLAAGVWSGIISAYNLPKDIYKKTGDLLAKAIAQEIQFEGGKAVIKATLTDLGKELAENAYVFSAAKTYQQVNETAKLLVSESGKVKTFSKFKRDAKKVFDQFNKHHLAAEYSAAVQGTQMAVKWQEFEADKDIFPLLRYQTVGDDRVRPTHRELDETTKPVNDEFWNTFYPPNGWRCRCTVEQLEADEDEITDTSKLKVGDDVPDVFQMNTGKQKIIYSDQHPYFEVVDRDKNLAMSNFNLEIPDVSEIIE